MAIRPPMFKDIPVPTEIVEDAPTDVVEPLEPIVEQEVITPIPTQKKPTKKYVKKSTSKNKRKAQRKARKKNR